MGDFDPSIIGTVIVALVGWLWRSRQQTTQQSIKDQLDAAITTEVHRIANDPEMRLKARGFLRAAAIVLLVRVGVFKEGAKLPGWASMLLDVAIEEGLAELAELLTRQRAEMVRATSALAAGAQGVADAFDGPTNPTVPRIGDTVVFEEIKEPPGPGALQVYGEDPDEPTEDAAPAAAAKVRAAIAKDPP